MDQVGVSWVDRVDSVRHTVPTFVTGSIGGSSMATPNTPFVSESGVGGKEPRSLLNNEAPSGSTSTDSQWKKDDKNQGGDARSYAQMVKENWLTEKGTPLQAVQDKQGEARMIAHELDPVHHIWGYCEMVYFSGRFPGRESVQKLTFSWKVPSQFHFHASGWIIFRFANEQGHDQVVFQGHYTMFGSQLRIHMIPRYFNFYIEEMSVVC